MTRPVAEFVRAHPDSRYPKYMHENCFKESHPKAEWKQWMMNNFFKGVHCSHCGVMLQCSCSVFKVSTGEECSHES